MCKIDEGPCSHNKSFALFLFLFRWNYDPCYPKTPTKVSSQGSILCQRTSNVLPPSRMNLRISPAAEF